MSPARTHYDSLKVTSDAPAEVVRAAYRVLAQRYHPDRNPGNPASAAVMALVNEAYRVLSDPELRQQYDLWLRSVEAVRNFEDISAAARSTGSAPGTSQRRNSGDENPEAPNTHNVPGSRSVDLDQMWDDFCGLFKHARSKTPKGRA